MSCCDCRCKQDQIKIRCTPTYYHHPIFQDFGNTQNVKTCHKKFRYPSQRLQNECYNRNICSASQNTLGKTNKEIEIQKNNKKQCYEEGEPTQLKVRSSSAVKYPNLQKQISFNPNSSTKFQNAGNYNPVSNHTLLWFDPEKSVLLRQSTACHHHGYSKERKLLQLSSCPFYPIDGEVHREFSKCGLCSKLSNCPLCGGYLFCNRCKADSTGKICNCGGVGYQNEICACSLCKKCGHPLKEQQKQIQKQVAQERVHEMKARISNCRNCLDSCPCGKVCFCSDVCTCCENKERSKQTNNSRYTNCPACLNNCSCGPNCICGTNCQCCKNLKDAEQSCGCNKGRCNCDDECSCGINCKCCPKFLPYGTCKCDQKCKCGANCNCKPNCNCCPKYQSKACGKYYKELNARASSCNCGPECGCGPNCRCGPLCKCQQKKSQYYANSEENKLVNKNTKAGSIAHGTRKTKIGQEAIRKSQPVFRSVTRQRI